MKNWKRVLAFVTAFVLCLSVFSGCGSSGNKENEAAPAAASSAATAEQSAAPADTAGQSFKIGMNNFVLGVQVQDKMQGYTDFCLKALGSEIFAVNDEGSPEKTLTNLQNMISAGVDGVIIFSVADTLSLSCAQMCEEAGVPFVLNDAAFADQELKEKVTAMDMYVGVICDDHFQEGAIAANQALEMGYKTAIVAAADYGSYGQDMKVKGFTETFTAAGGEVLAEARTDSSSTENMTTVTDDLISSHLDAEVFFIANTQTAAIAVQNLKKYGDDANMAVFVTTADSDAVNNLKSGDLKNCTYEAMICNIFSTVLLYNYLIGNPIVDKDGNKPYLESVIGSAVTEEWADTYSKIFLEDECCVTSDYVKSLCDGTLTYDQFVETVSTFDAEKILQMAYADGRITEDELKAAGYTPA